MLAEAWYPGSFALVLRQLFAHTDDKARVYYGGVDLLVKVTHKAHNAASLCQIQDRFCTRRAKVAGYLWRGGCFAFGGASSMAIGF